MTASFKQLGQQHEPQACRCHSLLSQHSGCYHRRMPAPVRTGGWMSGMLFDSLLPLPAIPSHCTTCGNHVAPFPEATTAVLAMLPRSHGNLQHLSLPPCGQLCNSSNSLSPGSIDVPAARASRCCSCSQLHVAVLPMCRPSQSCAHQNMLLSCHIMDACVLVHSVAPTAKCSLPAAALQQLQTLGACSCPAPSCSTWPPARHRLCVPLPPARH